MRKLKVIISGGGTGGHIFPALAIAKAIEKINTNVEFLFVGAQDRMEMEKIPNEGYKIIGLWISGFQRGLYLRNLLFPFKLLSSIFRAKKIIKDFEPDLAIGTGGYASAPLIYVAAKSSVPSIIQEQNSYPGVTNKILGRYVSKICVAYNNMEKFFPEKKLVVCGNPIRKDVLGFEKKKQQGQKLFQINELNPTVLVLGGSLGALTINNAIAENLNFFRDFGVNLIWQTGTSYQQQANSFVAEVGVKGITTYPFIKEMDKAYSISDIIISRAGAIAISELCCVGKPTILIPSPNVAENHQYKNAQSLVNKKAALLVEDHEASRKLVNILKDLLENHGLRTSLSSNIKKMAVTDSANRIANIALELLK